jgi:hypothetical protein
VGFESGCYFRLILIREVKKYKADSFVVIVFNGLAKMILRSCIFINLNVRSFKLSYSCKRGNEYPNYSAGNRKGMLMPGS